jgi:hypothetical protein
VILRPPEVRPYAAEYDSVLVVQVTDQLVVVVDVEYSPVGDTNVELRVRVSESWSLAFDLRPDLRGKDGDSGILVVVPDDALLEFLRGIGRIL